MKVTSRRMAVGAASAVGMVLVAAPGVAAADSSFFGIAEGLRAVGDAQRAVGDAQRAAEEAQRAVRDTQRTTDALLREAMSLTGGVDPKASPAGATGQSSRSGTYPTRKGTFLSTDTKVSGLIPTGHSAMVYSSSSVVESLSSGVQWGSNNWYAAKPRAWGMTTRGTTTAQDANAAEWARGKLGLPYNYNYYDMGTRSRFYCSQLVWAAFRDTTGIDLNTSAYDALGLRAIHPMELPSSANSAKVSTFYVK